MKTAARKTRPLWLTAAAATATLVATSLIPGASSDFDDAAVDAPDTGLAPVDAGGHEAQRFALNGMPTGAPVGSGAPPAWAGRDIVAAGERPEPIRIDATGQESSSVAELISANPQTLRDIVRTGERPDEVHAAVWAMGNRLALEDADVDALVARLASDRADEAAVRRAIVWALSLRLDRVPVDRVSELARDDATAAVRRTAVRTLSGVDDARVVGVLEAAALEDTDPQNRGEGVFLLSLRTPTERDGELAFGALERERDPQVRSRWVRYIGVREIAGRGALLDELVRATEESLEVRCAAAEVLAQQSPELAAALSANDALPEAVRARARRLSSR